MDEGGQNVQTSTYKISPRSVMDSMINKINTAMLYTKAVKRINPKSSHHQKKFFFYFFLILEMMDVH